MRKLVGKLSALDPEASETLKIVAYFDKLVDGRVGADGLMRGATILSGVPIGRRPASSKTVQRFGVDGVELYPGPSEGWPSVSSADGSTVWLERSGAPHVNDSMVLERLATGLSILSLRFASSTPPPVIEVTWRNSCLNIHSDRGETTAFDQGFRVQPPGWVWGVVVRIARILRKLTVTLLSIT